MGEVVAVALDQSRYNFGEPITVTIRNTLQVAIYGQTGQTFCDIVTAQRKEEGQWQDTGRCLAGAPPTFVELAPGSQAIARLQPRLPSDEPLAPGLYRISFPYTTDPQSGPWQTVYSREFVISSN